MSQKTDIKKHLKKGMPINPMMALNLFGCFRLASVIFDLKEEGMDIKTTMTKRKGKRFANYEMVKPRKLKVGDEVKYKNNPLDFSTPIHGKTVLVKSVLDYTSRSTGNQLVTLEGDFIVRDVNELES